MRLVATVVDNQNGSAHPWPPCRGFTWRAALAILRDEWLEVVSKTTCAAGKGFDIAMKKDEAEVRALAVLGWLAGDEALMSAFLAQSGMAPGDLAQVAGDAGFLAP